jgi:hypothetical protein
MYGIGIELKIFSAAEIRTGKCAQQHREAMSG